MPANKTACKVVLWATKAVGKMQCRQPPEGLVISQ
ncbi:hypothetical protein GGQ88_003276 [Novosphingobium hassiacum]|uniref:Uncharacterized protein n=1 Tax=Novosphingobium hassiacum TaxID=173676 RepID=A0A7W5ZYS0_9SPHN|nr:hypothetical protein [Novosphingobium hassiacum]